MKRIKIDMSSYLLWNLSLMNADGQIRATVMLDCILFDCCLSIHVISLWVIQQLKVDEDGMSSGQLERIVFRALRYLCISDDVEA